MNRIQSHRKDSRVIASLEFEKYAPTAPLLSSVPLRWHHLLVRTYHEPSNVPHLDVPGTEDPFIAVCFRGHRRIEGKDGDDTRKAALIATPCVFLRRAGEPAELEWRSITEEPVETAHLHLSSALLQQVAESAADRDPARVQLINAFACRDPVIEAVASAVVDELRRGSEAAHLYSEAAAQFLAVHLLRRYCSVSYAIHEPRGGLDRVRLKRVLDRIHEAIDRPVTLHELATLAGLSVYHFARLFKNATGLSPHRYIVRHRISAACRLLRTQVCSVADVAYAVGFQSVSQFTYQFRRHMRTSPAEFRHMTSTGRAAKPAEEFDADGDV